MACECDTYCFELHFQNQKFLLMIFGMIAVVVFPLFSYYRWKDRSLKDYMLTRENLDKMREHRDNKKI